VYRYHIFFIPSCVVEYLCWLYILAIVNSAATNVSVQVPPLYVDLHSFGYMSRSAMAESYGISILIFWRPSKLISIPTNSVYGSLLPPHPHQHLLCVFWLMVILTGVRGNPNIVLISLSSVAKGHWTTSCIY
jgi:hypothetical protein